MNLYRELLVSHHEPPLRPWVTIPRLIDRDDLTSIIDDGCHLSSVRAMMVGIAMGPFAHHLGDKSVAASDQQGSSAKNTTPRRRGRVMRTSP